MASDDDVIYVDIHPRLDDSATEKETGRLRDKLKEGAKGAGKAIGKVLHSEMAQELERGIEPLAREAGETLAKELGSAAGNFLHDQIADTLKGVGVDFDGLIDQTKKLSDTFNSFKQGDAAGGLAGIADSARAIGGKDGVVGNAADGLDNLGRIAGQYQGTYDSLKGDLKGITEGLSLFVAGAPAAEAAMAALGGAAELVLAPLAAFFGTVQIASSLTNHAQINPWGEGNPDPTKGFNSPIPSHPGIQEIPLPGAPAVPPGYTATPGSLDPFTALLPPGMQSLPASPGTAGPSLPSIAPPDTGGAPAHTSGFATGGGIPHVTLADFTTPSDPGGVVAAGGNVSTLYRFAQSLEGTPYSQALRNDCSGIVSELASVAAGLPPPAAGGRFSTANEGESLARLGFQSGVGGPNDLNVGWYNGGPGGGHTAATLPGGVNAEQGGSHGSFTLGPGAAGAGNPEFTNHAHLSMGGGGGVRAAGYGTGGMPLPPGLGGYTPRPMQGGGGGSDGGGGPMQQQPLGHGEGAGVGGGMIGLAEQAGAMAAGAMTFGAGSIAAQMAEQEMNLAVKKGTQMAAVAAMAPFETFGLAGGQMGAPSVNPGGGWPGKLLGGLIGQQTNSPNIAGKTQPPKQPQEDSSQNDPGGGNGGKSQGGGGPSGDHDDPIHVKSVSPGGPPQGSATSALSATGYMSGSLA